MSGNEDVAADVADDVPPPDEEEGAVELRVLNETPGATFVVRPVKLSGLDGEAVEPPPIWSASGLAADGSSRIVSSGEGVTVFVGVSDDPEVVVVLVSGVVVVDGLVVEGLVVCGVVVVVLSLGAVVFGSVVVCAEVGLAKNKAAKIEITARRDIGSLRWTVFKWRLKRLARMPSSTPAKKIWSAALPTRRWQHRVFPNAKRRDFEVNFERIGPFGS